MNAGRPPEMPGASDTMDRRSGRTRRVGLFVTCLVDLFRPTVGFAAVKLLRAAGCTVEVPTVQTCCGQPAYNSGARSQAQAIARQVVAAFEGFDWVVAPSGSCAGMLRRHYPDLLRDDDGWGPRAAAVAARARELMSFLVDVCGVTTVEASFRGIAAYHDSCSSLRDMGVRDQPRELLASVGGLELREVPETEACCGFGGVFSVKYGPISADIASRKVDALASVDPDVVVGGDLGCLMNIAGRMRRDEMGITVRHAAELLADMTEDPGIGAPEEVDVRC